MEAPHCSTCRCQSTPISFETPELPDAVKDHTLSNEPPSASDMHMLREYRLSLDPYLTRLDTEISALSAVQEQLQKELDLRKATLDALRIERRVLEERLQSISGALSPLRRLPYEIIQEIFLCTLAHSREPDYTWFNVFDREDSLWTVRRVCHKWRTASQYPHIWTGLRISWTGSGNLSMFRAVFGRSCSLPLRIYFEWGDPHNYRSRFGRTVLDELVKHSERWQYASLQCVDFILPRPISTLRGRLPKLEELNFHPWDLRRNDYIEDGHPFEITPLLTKAIILRAVVKLNYSRLESFTSTASTPTAFKVLVSSPFLTYLENHSRAASNDDSPQAKSRYLHSRLNTLLLEQCSQLNLFTLPNLQHLEAGPTFASELFPSLPIIYQFLHVSRCSLLSLAIYNCQLGSMPELLQLVPRLQSLSININGYSMVTEDVASSNEALSDLINRLAAEGPGPSNEFILVPKLQSFVFESSLEAPWRFMDTSIVDLIRARSDMKSVSIIIHPDSLLPNLSDDDVDCLRTIKNDGFNVSILRQAQFENGSVLV
ncbi:hypothetical protein CPB85DRAFT_481631 [Mucidula mucida]|nr:hypothetical protein CPB85DRAFT_481631 [Mucidula mucida]